MWIQAQRRQPGLRIGKRAVFKGHCFEVTKAQGDAIISQYPFVEVEEDQTPTVTPGMEADHRFEELVAGGMKLEKAAAAVWPEEQDRLDGVARVMGDESVETLFAELDEEAVFEPED